MKDFLILLITFAGVLLFSCATGKKEQIIERDIPRFYEDINLPVALEIRGDAFKEGFYRSCVVVGLKAEDSIQYSITQGRIWEEYSVPFEVCITAPLMVRLKDMPNRYKVFSVNIDTEPPEINAIINPLPNQSGWNNSDVNITFQCRDNLSGVDECPASRTITAEEARQMVMVMATDRAGNIREFNYIINIDKTPPEVSIAGIVDGKKYYLCENPTGSYIYHDRLSGVKTSSFYIKGGNENGTGIFYLTVEDNAGNTKTETLSYHIIYSFDGFISFYPFEMPFKKGTVIPVGFVLSDGCRNNVYNARAILKLEKVSDEIIDCEPIDTEILFGDYGDVFRYDYIDNQYRYDISTENLSQGRWRITVMLDDGMEYIKEFFVK